MDTHALRLSAELAALTTLILLGLGLPLAWWLATSRFRLKFLVEAVVALPLVLPPTVLGFYLLTGLAPRTPLGRAFEAVAGHPFPFSFEGLLVASVLYSLPFAIQPFAAAFAGVDRRLVEASHTLGVSRVGTFLRGPSGVTSTSASIQAFYRELDRLEELAAGMKKAIDLEDRENYDRMKAEEPNLQGKLRQYRAIRSEFSEIGKDVARVFAHPTLTDNERRDLLDRAYERMTNIARKLRGKAPLETRHPEPIPKTTMDKWMEDQRRHGRRNK